MKNKVLTNSLRTLTSNILILETKQLKTSFWEVRLLYFSFFKKSFLKVTQTLLSFLSFFFRSIWLIPLKPFFPKFLHSSKFFLVMLLHLWKRLVFTWTNYDRSKKTCAQGGKACTAYFMEKTPGIMPSAQSLHKFALLWKYWVLLQ